MSMRLGDLLVRQGVLTEAQRDAVLAEQRLIGRPFGVLAERMFGVSPNAVERAWAEQYASIARRVDPRKERLDPYALRLVERRQAWQFRVLPMRFVPGVESLDGAVASEDVLVCTTQSDLARALKFTGWRLGHVCHFVIAEPSALGEALARHYPMAGLSADDLRADAA